MTGDDPHEPEPFGDAEPEDSWDPDDPIPELVANLVRRRRRDAAVRDRDRTLADLRAALFDDDLGHVLTRLTALLERLAPMIVGELDETEAD